VDVSVVVCTYNRARSLRLTLDALAAQVTPSPLEWELIVIDNNSADATRSVVEGFATSAPIRVRYGFEGRQGLSQARNAGIATAAGAILAFTDDDVRPAPDWVASLSVAMRAAGADIVGGRILPAWEAPPPAWLEKRPLLQRELAVMAHPDFAAVVDSHGLPPVWGANMALRKEVFETVGAFDVGRGVRGAKLYRGEEVDLVGRALAAGFRAVYDPRVVVWHRIATDRLRRRYFSRLYFQHAEGRAMVCDEPDGRLVLGVPRLRYWTTVRMIGGWLWAAVRGRTDTLDRWLDCCDAVGFVWGRWKRHRPGLSVE
jgi:glycosyltransferase involved in cell wall biosynthesis